MSNPLRHKLIAIVEPVLEAAGYELVDLRFAPEQGGWTLRVCVDLPLDPALPVGEVPEDRVDLEDCENLSRELSAVLDVEDPITQAYSLEISSPGIERPLRTPAHFQHFNGSEAKVELAIPIQTMSPNGTPNERRNFRGTLAGLDPTGTKALIDVDGKRFELAIADIEHAHLIPDWDAVMAGKSGLGKQGPKPIKPGHRPSAKKN